MKGINLKKIGAIVAGTAILASSIGFAGLFYKNTELVKDDGQPVVKVVVGANAAASDGVAAANIAAKIANEAYKSTTLTAAVVGSATCSAGEGEGASGECSVVENSETVTLEITVPGAGVEGVHTYETAIGDYVDRELKNRYTSASDVDEAFTVYDAYDDVDANPFQDHLGDVFDTSDFSTSSEDNTAMYLVGNSNFAPFADVTISDSLSGNEYLETQGFYTHGEVDFDSSDDQVEGDVRSMTYSVVFDPSGDYGIPLCPGDVGTSYEDCDTTDRIDTYRTFIKFLGEDWVISDVEPNTKSTAVQDGETYHISGSSVTLAKEVKWGIVYVGGNLSIDGYQLVLTGISRETGMGNSHPAIFVLKDSNGEVVCDGIQIYPGETKDPVCPGVDLKVHIYQTAAGLENIIARWAEVAVYDEEVELEDGKDFAEHIDGVSDSDWDVHIGWANKGDDPSAVYPEYLRTIVLHNDEGSDDNMLPGDSLNVVDVSRFEKYRLTYNGIYDDDAEYSDVKMDYDDRDMTVYTDTSSSTCTLDGHFIHVSANNDGEFRTSGTLVGGDTKTVRGSDLYFIYNASEVTATGCTLSALDSYLVADDGDHKWLYKVTDNYVTGNTDMAVSFRYAGSNGYLLFYNDTAYSTGSTEHYALRDIFLVEDAGKYKVSGTTRTVVDALGATVTQDGRLYGTDDDEMVWLLGYDSDANQIRDNILNFDNFGYDSNSSYGTTFYSMRGSVYDREDNSMREIRVPDKVLPTTWSFSTVETEETEPDTNTYTLHEGEEVSIGTTGVRVKVLSIDEELTPCSVSGSSAGSACTPNMEGVSAVINPDNVASMEASVPYQLTSNLVVLDRDVTEVDSGVVITVGGPAVNTVTAQALEGSDVDLQAAPVVRVLGNKIVVAGYTAEDTLTAAEQFISELQRA